MKQEQFVARHQHEWQQLELWLQQRAGASRRRRRRPEAADPGDVAFAQRYRRLCQQLALARERGYSPQLVQRLQQLMQQGHSVLYRTPPVRWRRALEFLVADFPMLVRSQARSMWVALAMFAVPALACFAVVQLYPDSVHLLMDNSQIAEMERMYDPAADRLGRDSGTDWMMFGYYIMNNIS
ncbi:MAG TPA: stage II sporulation protein M, partial [Stenotrophomonas sp.]|nr:stage II sporulation protein M [Stenotrophomonas sp.]